MMRVELVAEIDSPSGYSAHARQTVLALHQSGKIGKEFEFQIVNNRKEKLQVDLVGEDGKIICKYVPTEKRRFKPDIRVMFEPAQYFNFDGTPSVGFVHWETTRIPPRMAERLSRCNGLIVSAFSVAKAFLESGVTAPVTVIPGPIYPRQETGELNIDGLTIGTDGPIEKKDRPFVVGYMAQWTQRKNIQTFIEDTAIAFKNSEAVVLLKTYLTGRDDERKDILANCKAIRERIGKADMPRMIVITERLSDPEISKFFNSVDLYYAPSRGEGYSMPVSFAAMADCDLMIPNWGGPTQFLAPSKACKFIKGSFSPAIGQSSYSWDQMWFDVDRGSAIQEMRSAYENRPTKEDLDKRRKFVDSVAGPEVFASAFLRTLKQTLESPKKEPVGAGTIVAPKSVKT